MALDSRAATERRQYNRAKNSPCPFNNDPILIMGEKFIIFVLPCSMLCWVFTLLPLKKHIQTNFKELVIFQTTHHGLPCSKDKGENVFIHPFSMKRNVLAWIGAKRRLLHFAHNYTGQLLIIFSRTGAAQPYPKNRPLKLNHSKLCKWGP